MKFIKNYLNKHNIFYLIQIYLFLCFLEILLFTLYYARFYDVYSYHHMKFNYSFYKICIDYIRLNSLIIFPLFVPFEMLFLYIKSKSILFTLIENIIICIFVIYLNCISIYLNFFISILIGLILILVYKFINSLKSKKFLFYILQNIFILSLIIFSLYYTFYLFLYTLNYNELGYILSGMNKNEYAYIAFYMTSIPIIVSCLFVKPTKNSAIFYLFNIACLIIYFIFKKYTIDYIKDNLYINAAIYILYSFIVL